MTPRSLLFVALALPAERLRRSRRLEAGAAACRRRTLAAAQARWQAAKLDAGGLAG